MILFFYFPIPINSHKNYYNFVENSKITVEKYMTQKIEHLKLKQCDGGHILTIKQSTMMH